MKKILFPWHTVAAAALIGMIFLFFFHSYSRSCQVEAIKERLTANAAAASLAVDGDSIEKIRAPSDRTGEHYRKVLSQLMRLANIHSDIAFVYTMRKLPDGRIAFVVDPQREQDRNGDGKISEKEKPAEIGQIYTQAGEDLMMGFQVPSVDRKITRDAWGAFLSGYAPVRNSRGEVVGLLGIDMDLLTLEGKLARLDTAFMSALALYLLLCLAMFLFCRARDHREPSASLQGQNKD